ncbi:CueP family metal-binding protein [Marinobacter hydrocarbonoclasticus]|nr:CueP family metal-binding protein [Marinobacter nauticus]
MNKLILSTLLVLGLSACGQSETEQQAKAFAALDHQAAVLQGHQWYKNEEGIVVRIHPDRVNAIFADGTEANVAIPADQFYLSIAPWATYTHPCGNHVPTGCTGELIGKPMHVSAVDINSGEEVLNQMITTQHDGFIDFWVPAQRQLAFTFHYEHPELGLLEAKEVLPTFQDSRTCITTMQLVPMERT